MRNEVLAYLKANGVSKLKYAVGTHPHYDHIGGLDMVLMEMENELVLMPDVSHPTDTYEDVLTAIKLSGAEFRSLAVGDTFPLGEAVITILSTAREYEDLNDCSIVMRIVYGENSFLLAGDATGEAEADILSSGFVLNNDVLKVGHHGSSSSSSYIFLREVMPEYAVITCGADNEYGHPHEKVISRLKDLEKVNGTITYRSDLNGTVVIESDGQNLTVTSENG